MQRPDPGPNPAYAFSTPSWSGLADNPPSLMEPSPSEMASQLRQMGFAVLHPQQAHFLRVLRRIAEQKRQRDASDNQWFASLPPGTKHDILANMDLYNVHPHEYVLGIDSFNALIDAGLGLCFANSSWNLPTHAPAPAFPPSPVPAAAPPVATSSQRSTSGQALAAPSTAFVQSTHASQDGRAVQKTVKQHRRPCDPAPTTCKAPKARNQYRPSSHQLIIRHRIKSLRRSTAKSDSRLPKTTKPLPPHSIMDLPPELIQLILKHAQLACRSIETSDKVEEASRKGKGKAMMSLMEAQSWALSMALVCRAWRLPALSNVWSDVVSRDIDCLDRLLETLSKWPHLAELACDGAQICTGKLLPEDIPLEGLLIVGSLDCPVMVEQSDPLDISINDERHFASKVAKIIRLAKNVKDINIQLWQRLLVHPTLLEYAGVRYMNASLHAALCTSTLRHVQFDFLIIYADLELLLLASTTLREVVLAGGLDAVDTADEISPREHSLPLEILHVVHNCFVEGSIGPLQLDWLLRPAIGHLKEVCLILTVFTRTVPDINGDPSTLVLPQPYTTTTFANLLIDLSSTLEVLILSTSIHRSVMGLALHEHPHRGSFDFALSHCTRLRCLSMPWQLTSSRLLQSLEKMQELDSMCFQGQPRASCDASEFTAMVESRVWPKLKKINLMHFRLNSGTTVWTAQSFRKLIRVCKSRGIELIAK